MSRGLPIEDLLTALSYGLTASDIIESRVKGIIASKLMSWRYDHDMSTDQFAKLLGVSKARVVKMENGDYNFNVEELSRISEKLGLSLSISLT